MEPELKPPVLIESKSKSLVVNSPSKKSEPEANPVVKNLHKKVKREIPDEDNDTKSSRKTFKRIRIIDDEDDEEKVENKVSLSETKENEFEDSDFKITKMEDVLLEHEKPLKNEVQKPKEIPKQVSRVYLDNIQNSLFKSLETETQNGWWWNEKYCELF